MKAEKKTLTPKLRFPDFKDAPTWCEKPFGDLYAFKPTNTLSRDKLNYQSGTIRNIHYGDIHTRFQTLFDIQREVVPFVTNGSADHFDEDAFCTEGDLVFADASEDLNDVGKSIEVVALHGERVLSGTHTILATRRDAQLSVGFGGYLFRTERMREQIRREAQGSKVYGISAGRLANVSVCFPAKHAEQRKIAACLTSLDEWIAAEGRKLEALRAYKKGLMQQLFPREGETLPRLRFPEFRDGPGWATEQLNQLATFVNDRVATSRLSLSNYVSTENLLPDFGGITTAAKLPSTTGATKYIVGDILVSNIRPYLKKVWHSDREGGASNDIVVIRPAGAALKQYLPHVLKSDAFIGYVTNGAKGVKMPRGDIALMAKYPVSYPSPAEQRKIAACLTSLDNWIAAERRKLDGLRTHKKGLMQQLFPSPEEM